MITVKSAVRENERITTLTFEYQTPDIAPQWTPGQFVRLSVERDGAWSEEHTFTVSSAPGDALQVTVKAVGPFTTALQTIAAGTPAHIRGPMGSFCKGIESLGDVTMVAGGVGITPFMSVLRHFKQTRPGGRYVLLWANNTVADLVRHDEFRSIMSAIDLRIVHVLWHEGQVIEPCIPCGREHCERGLITADTFRAHTAVDTASIFMCGPPPMIAHTKAVVAELGIDHTRVHAEAQVVPKSPAPVTPPAGG